MSAQSQIEDEEGTDEVASPPTKGGRQQSRRDSAITHVQWTDGVISDIVAQELLSARFVWSPGDGWRRWSGRHWSRVTKEEVREEIKSALIRMATRHVEGGNFEIVGKLKPFLMRSKLDAVRDLAGAVPGIFVEASDFDAHPDLLNVRNGVVDLRSGELHPHEPELLLTKLAPVDYVPSAQHEDWEAALQALPTDVQSWYQLRIGQAATGHMTPDDVMVVQVGGGANGKTTVASAIRAALGDYFVDVTHRALLANPGDHPTELMAFRGARVAMIEETPEARRLSTVRLKQTVGTPTMQARYIARDNVTWKTTHSLFLSTNYRPEVEETDNGTWRRLALVSFPFTFRPPGHALNEAAGERTGDPDLRARLQSATSGQLEAVLSWIVEGSVRWHLAGKDMGPLPERIATDTRAWRAESDLVMAYLDERLEFDSSAHVASTDLLADFNAWLAERGHRAWSDKTFSARFSSHTDLAGRVTANRARRSQPGLSRPQQFWNLPGTHTPERFRAWFGVRFASDNNQKQHPGTGGTAVSVAPHERPLREPTRSAVPPVPPPLGSTGESSGRGQANQCTCGPGPANQHFPGCPASGSHALGEGVAAR
jgi:putative DNA primase/helicase